MEADRTELKDLAKERTPLAAELEALWDKWAAGVGLKTGKARGGSARREPEE